METSGLFALARGCGNFINPGAGQASPCFPRSPLKPKVYLHADATQPATGHLALPVLSLPFPVSPMSRC